MSFILTRPIVRPEGLSFHGRKARASRRGSYPQYVSTTVDVSTAIEALLHIYVATGGNFLFAGQHLRKGDLAFVASPHGVVILPVPQSTMSTKSVHFPIAINPPSGN